MIRTYRRPDPSTRYARLPKPEEVIYEYREVEIDERTMTVAVPGGVVTAEGLDAYHAQVGGWTRVSDPAQTVTTTLGVSLAHTLTAPPTTMTTMAHPAYRYAWQQLRADWHRRLLAIWAAGKTYPCRRCGQPLTPADANTWQLGHATDKALGGTTAGAAPEHRRCNLAAGAQLGNRLRHRPRLRRLTPSRAW